MDLKPLLKNLQTEFKDISQLKQALIHRSFLNENHHDLAPNERLEFLGDAVLELWCSQALYLRFPEFDEGNLTNLRALIVCTPNLAKIAADINLGNFVSLSKGEENHGGRSNLSILADTFEAVIGAIYLDGGYKSAFNLLDRLVTPSIDQFAKQDVYKDPKSLFQEIAQAKHGVTPHYETLDEKGPDHNKIFKVGVFIEDKLIASGKGPSKQKAEEDAALQAAKVLS